MQTYIQTFTGNNTWTLHVPGKYFTTLQCTNAVNVRFYLGGKQLDLGQISQLLAGLEVTLGEIDDPRAAFDRVEIDVTGPDTVAVGIGNGQARYNRSAGSVNILGTVPVSGPLTDAQLRAAAVTVRDTEAGEANWTNTGTLTGLSPVLIFAAGSNPNGAIIHNMESIDFNASAYMLQCFIAKATAPAGTADGEVLAIAMPTSTSAGVFSTIKRERNFRIAPGLGLYFISAVNGAANLWRRARYTLL